MRPPLGRRILHRPFGIAAYDLPTRDKLPILQRLLREQPDGLALDIGIGTGYTTYQALAGRPTACVDLHVQNLLDYRRRIARIANAQSPWCIAAQATALPFRTGAFSAILCSEVLEHLEEDEPAVREIARLLAPRGRVVITVPYTGLGFTGFLELCGLKTVHDFPGPERHVRAGYDERVLHQLLARYGLHEESHEFYLRFFTKLATDCVSLLHGAYQRFVRHRRAWSWSDVTAEEGGIAFRCYACLFPILWVFSRLDWLLSRSRGFGLIMVARKSAVQDSSRGAG